MTESEKTIGCYCNYCKKNVKCKVVVSSVRVQSPHVVEVEIDAHCPMCDARLVYGGAYIRLP